jgi:glutaredoxin 3
MMEMNEKHRVELFSAGCAVCEEAIATVKRLAGDSGDVQVLDMSDIDVVKRARALGVRSVPAVAVDGRLASCCAGRGLDEQSLQAAGLGGA